MIQFERKILDNGLEVIVHQDTTSTMAAVNVLYKVGSRNEKEDKTGIAHLFEHLMFSGSKHAPDFDMPIQEAGGENNAFTNSDITNYYELLPAPNLDIALWLESDRMANLVLTHELVDVQKKVVVEEFNEVCLNKPYGDSWHHLSALAYTKYPYKWPTIGLTPDHVKSIDIQDATDFYKAFYQPKNAILTICSPLTNQEMLQKATEWFGDIQSVDIDVAIKEVEPPKAAISTKVVKGRVPATQIYIGFPMVDRLHKDYYIYDLLSDILGYGVSSRLYDRLVKNSSMFTSLSAFVSGSDGPGLFLIDGRLTQGTAVEEAKAAIWKQLEELTRSKISNRELQKVKNKAISSIKFGDVSLLNKAINLAYYANLGDASIINREEELYESVTTADIHRICTSMFKDGFYNELIYLPE